MLELSLCFFGVGARMRYSMWIRSHQKGLDSLEGVEEMMALIVCDCRRRNIFLLFPLR